jgi:hypothetical protein
VADYDGVTLLDQLNGSVCGTEYECNYGRPASAFSFILEADRIRILPRKDALAFWKQWWADEQAKLKK